MDYPIAIVVRHAILNVTPNHASTRLT